MKQIQASLVPIPNAEANSGSPIVLKRNLETIGRSPANTIPLQDPLISKTHAKIVREGADFHLVDLHSSNGSYVNERPVATCRLFHGDEISVGRSKFTFTLRELAEISFAENSQALGTQVLKASSIDELIKGLHTEQEKESDLTFSRLQATLQALSELSQINNIELLCQKILDVTKEVLKPERGMVLLYQNDNLDDLKLVASVGTTPATESLNISRTIVDAAVENRSGILAADVQSDERFAEAKSVMASGMRSVMCVPLLDKTEVFGIVLLSHSGQIGAFTPTDLDMFTAVATGAGMALANAHMAQRLARAAQTRQSLERFLSPVLVEQVINNQVSLKRGGNEQEVTVMFADIRGFTSLTERSAARDVVVLLNEYFDRMVEVIFNHDGILDKFIGDAIMALWGPPLSKEDDASKAVQAAITMQKELLQLNNEREKRGQSPIEIGIGLASGVCVAGNIGARRRMEYTVIGDAVNLSSRLSSIAEAGEVICDEATFKRVGSPNNATELPPTEVKGKQKPVKLYRAWSSEQTTYSEMNLDSVTQA
ncbi:MAG: FHA domain-containing protein [Deltaproteobacteria bacterium]|nr:FHA domain-containing protein [Deltaproteobacteria bacterium]MBT6434796.1 FHA domain-containing protein [Deltaproteobacteria bacterium]